MSTQTPISILVRIESLHAARPTDALVLNSEQETTLRTAVAAAGGTLTGNPATPPTYTGRALVPCWTRGDKPAHFVQLEDAPVIGTWAGATLVAERAIAQPSATSEVADHLTQAARDAACGDIAVARSRVFAAACVAARETMAAEPGTASNQDWGARLGALQALAARMAA